MEHHADALAQRVDIDVGIHVFAVQENLSVNAAVLDEVVHAVDGFQKR